MLNEQQSKIVNTPGGKVVVLAGAGSGKTHTLIELIADLHLRRKIPLSKMFISTFTNKAGNELKQRLSSKLNRDSVEDLWVGTMHSQAHKFLSTQMKYSVITEGEVKYLIKKIYLDIVPEHTRKELTVDYVVGIIGKKRSFNCKFEDLTSVYTDLIKSIYIKFMEEKQRQHLMDFDDLLYNFLTYLKDNPSFSDQFEWVFIDENQDCNWVQNEIADVLGGESSVFRIGDDFQSIYTWRGACPSIFKDKTKTADSVYPLETNYRSSPEILDLANEIIKKESGGRKLYAVQSTSLKPSLRICEDQAQTILSRIVADIRNGVPLGEIAVLSRSVKTDNIRTVVGFLKSRKIPYVVRGGIDIFKTADVQKFLSIIRGVLSPSEYPVSESLGLLPGVGAKTAIKLTERIINKGVSELDSLTAKFSQTAAFEVYKTLWDKKGNDLVKNSYDFYSKFYLSKYETQLADNKRQFISGLMEEFLLGVHDLQATIDSLLIEKEEDETTDKIVITTIHQSKGLEWESVHLANFYEGYMPMIKEDSDELEELNLAYVAITRAKKYLQMYMPKRNIYGYSAQVSRYLLNITKEHQNKFFETYFSG